ncbi:MAG: response regulator [Haloferacaceae archaeon]|jgi:two-component system chemotaxis response regulator CheY
MTLGILIVDDSDYMRARIKSALDEDEFEIVDEAQNGAWAVKKFKQHQEDVDLVMMDIVMRKANGVKATAAIKKLDPDTRVIMCTSVGQKKKMHLAAKAGADGYITKPFGDEDVVEAIAEVMGEKQAP